MPSSGERTPGGPLWDSKGRSSLPQSEPPGLRAWPDRRVLESTRGTCPRFDPVVVPEQVCGHPGGGVVRRNPSTRRCP